MATKKDQDDQIKLLKEEVRRLRTEAKSTEATLEGLSSDAHGVIIKDGHFNLVSIKFNVESGKAAIEKVDDLGKSIGMASSKVKHAVIDTLVAISKRRK